MNSGASLDSQYLTQKEKNRCTVFSDDLYFVKKKTQQSNIQAIVLN